MNETTCKCGKPARDGFKTCQSCADAAAEYQRKYYEKRTAGVQPGERKAAMKKVPAEIAEDQKKVEDSPMCGAAGCRKPARDGSTQCERHYQKSLRNNLRYRARAKSAMNGDGDWKHQAVTALLSQRDILLGKIAEIDSVLSSIKGL